MWYIFSQTMKKYHGKKGVGKLIRDKVAKHLAQKGTSFEIREANESEYLQLLIAKFEEEYNEFVTAKTQEARRGELADIQAVMTALTGLVISRRLVVPTYDSSLVTKDFRSEHLEYHLFEAHERLVAADVEGGAYGPEFLMALADMTNIMNRIIHSNGTYAVKKSAFDKEAANGGFQNWTVLLWTQEPNTSSGGVGIYSESAADMFSGEKVLAF